MFLLVSEFPFRVNTKHLIDSVIVDEFVTRLSNNLSTNAKTPWPVIADKCKQTAADYLGFQQQQMEDPQHGIDPGSNSSRETTAR